MITPSSMKGHHHGNKHSLFDREDMLVYIVMYVLRIRVKGCVGMPGTALPTMWWDSTTLRNSVQSNGTYRTYGIVGIKSRRGLVQI